jgi:hypothetical protein
MSRVGTGVVVTGTVVGTGAVVGPSLVDFPREQAANSAEAPAAPKPRYARRRMASRRVMTPWAWFPATSSARYTTFGSTIRQCTGEADPTLGQYIVSGEPASSFARRVRRRRSRFLGAVDDDGVLHVDGHDLGAGNGNGQPRRRVRVGRTIAAADVPRLVEEVGGRAGEDVWMYWSKTGAAAAPMTSKSCFEKRSFRCLCGPGPG